MYKVIKARLEQKFRTMKYPDGPAPELPARFAGKPEIASGCDGCNECVASCPVSAISIKNANAVELDLGRCIFCRACEIACPKSVVKFGKEYRLAAARREDLIVRAGPSGITSAYNETAADYYARSLKLRQVSAGGCGACEADSNVLGTVGWDMGRFGIQFVASPRHAECLLVTGPVTENMKLALKKTFDATPGPKLVIAVGACAIAGGPYIDHAEQNNGASSVTPVDLFIPGCPPNPLVILDGLLRFIGKIKEK